MTDFLTQETAGRFTVETGYGSLLDETSPVRAEATVTPSQPTRTVRRQTHRHIATTTATVSNRSRVTAEKDPLG